MAYGLNVGGTPLVKSFYGTVPVKRIYVGSTHVWPLISSAVVYSGSQVFSGTTSVAMPVHSVGDLLVVLANGITAPTAPTGWTVAHTTSGSGAPNATLAFRVATAGGTSTGSWMNNAFATAFVFKNAHASAPIGAIATNPIGTASVTCTAPALTLVDGSGASVVAHSFYNGGSTGAWVNKIQGGFVSRNQQARVANNQLVDSFTAVAESSVMTHSASAVGRGVAFEILPPAAPVGLYGVDVVYLPNYEVQITAKTSYAAGDPNEAFFFRSTPTAKDGYTARTFTKQWSSNATQTCTLEDYWANPTGVRNTVDFKLYPKA